MHSSFNLVIAAISTASVCYSDSNVEFNVKGRSAEVIKALLRKFALPAAQHLITIELIESWKMSMPMGVEGGSLAGTRVRCPRAKTCVPYDLSIFNVHSSFCLISSHEIVVQLHPRKCIV